MFNNYKNNVLQQQWVAEKTMRLSHKIVNAVYKNLSSAVQQQFNYIPMHECFNNGQCRAWGKQRLITCDLQKHSHIDILTLINALMH